MVLARVWDSSCPRVWDQWERDGVKWVIQDIPPEDDETALMLMVDRFLPDEVLCSIVGVSKDPESVESLRKIWQELLKDRVSIGCYAEVNGKRTLAALNCCFIKQKNGPKLKSTGEPWLQVEQAMGMAEQGIDSFSLIGDDKYLYGFGLFVDREFRGAGLGARVLKAREPICRLLGLAGTFTVFTGPAAQRSAEKAGFKTLSQVSMKKMAEAGLGFPNDETRVVKYMWIKYD